MSSVRVFPAEVRGGPSLHRTRYGTDHVYNPGGLYDIFVALSNAHYELHRNSIAPHAAVMLEGDPDTFDPVAAYPELAGRTVYVVPMEKIARDEIKDPRAKNMVAVGACACLYDFSREGIEENLAERYRRKDEKIYRNNLGGFVAGYKYAQERLVKNDPYKLKPAEGEGLLIVSGNEAIGMGGLMAGCRFFGGYPITPASEVMEFMAAELPKVGGVMYQAEDEIASIGMVLGAGFSGVRSMTSTSGPGLSLMTELLGLAGMAEIPCVVVDVQRGGPSTGLPTKTEQSDLNLSLALSHGDAPKVIMAPISIHDCFDIMFRAFDVAERYQVPVIVLSEQALGHRRADLPKSMLRELQEFSLKREPRVWEKENYLRFQLTESGISPRAIPGDRGGAHVITGLEHGENGGPRHDPENRKAMCDKRWRKLATIEREFRDAPYFFGPEEAALGIIGWGATAGAVREAVEIANHEGLSVRAMYPRILFPNLDHDLRPFIQKHKVVAVLEENQSGQYAGFLQSIYGAELGFRPERILKYDGNAFRPDEVLSALRAIAGKHGLAKGKGVGAARG
jgi:2-oxoglutarate ferredoxin oxidoreductase subunit alpha